MKGKVWKLLSLLSIAIFVLVPARTVLATGTLQPSSIITGAGGGPVVYDSGMGEIFAQAIGGATVISDSNNSIVATASVGIPSGDAHELVYDPGVGEIFESWGGTGDGAPATISVISDSNNSVIGAVTYNVYQYSPTFPLGMAYDSGKGEIFICDSGYHARTGYTYGGGVYVVNDSTNAIIGSISVAVPNNVVYDSGKGEIFVAAGANTVSVISDSNNTVVVNVTVGNSPYGLAYDSAKGEVFVFNEAGGTLSVISDSSNSVVATINGLTPESAISIAYNPAKGEIFASNVTISDSTNAVIAGITPYEYPNNGGTVAQNFGDVVYDSGKGEVFATGLVQGIGVFSDTSIPEFSSATVLAAIVVVTVGMVALKVKKPKRSR